MKLDKWTEDKNAVLEFKIKDTDTQIEILNAETRKTAGLERNRYSTQLN